MSKIIFSDMDGTLTNNELLSPSFFEVLNFAKDRGHPFVIVTGRSMSWGHFLLTHFEIDYVISEGGGVIAYKKNGYIEEKVLVPEELTLKLSETMKSLEQVHSDIPHSKDSYGRLTDRAIEYHLMNEEQDKKATDFLKIKGAHFSRSSVHINYWYGEVSKYKAVCDFQEMFFPKVNLDECVYFGDSTNDESMFQYFKNSVGVSNISKVLDKLTYKPSVILEGQDNEGVFGVLNYLKSSDFNTDIISSS